MTRVFISITSQDLRDCLTAAIEACQREGAFPVAMEHFAAMSAGATPGSRQKLEVRPLRRN